MSHKLKDALIARKLVIDTKLGSIFYKVLQNLTPINVHEVSYVVHVTKVHTVVLMIFSVTIAQ